jgi:hypothetical protein
MKLGNFKRIISNDYPEDNQKLIEQLGRQLNDAIEQLFAAVNGKLTFNDNILSSSREVEVIVNTAGIPLNRTSISLDRSDVVNGCIVISVVNKTNAASYPTTSPFISFTQNGTQLFIDHVTGLQANNRYLLKLIALN